MSPSEPKLPFLADQRLSLLEPNVDVLRHLDVEAFRPQRDKGGFHGDEYGKDSPWRPLERMQWAQDIRSEGRFRRCVVVSDAGMGKSTNLEWLQMALAHLGQALVFCLRIEDLPKDITDFLDFLTREYWRKALECGEHSGLTPDLAREILIRYQQRGRLILLLDSLDQAPDNGDSEKTLQHILTREEWSRCPIVLSTRPHALSTRWKRLSKGHEAAWRFLRIEQLDEKQQERLLGEIIEVNADGTEVRTPRLQLIPRDARGSLGVPRVCEIFWRLKRRDDFTGLKTLADVTWKATTEMLLEGLRACDAGEILAWNRDKGKVPNSYRPIQRNVAFHILAALAFQMFVNPDEHNEPGSAPNLEGVLETATEGLLFGVLNRLTESKARLQSEKRLGDMHLLGSVEAEDFFVNFDAVCATNAGPLENYVLDDGGRHKALRWRNPTLQAFFAAAWACRFASPEDIALLRGWVVDPWNEATQVYAEFWRFASEMKSEARHRPTWEKLMGLLYDETIVDAEGYPIRSTEFLSRSWLGMAGTVVQSEWLLKYKGLVSSGNAVALELEAGMEPITAGTFWMGSPDEDSSGYDDERPYHEVSLKSFRMSSTPVTNGEYELFDPGHVRHRGKFEPDGKPEPNDNLRPVVNISWYDAWIFAKWTDKKLPTEAQWEYSCRGGSTVFQRYSFGDTLTLEQANFNGRFDWGDPAVEGSPGKTTPVGSYPPNGFGLYDMHGNVWEWCADWYDGGFYDTNEATQPDPCNLVAAGSPSLRGGSWGYAGRGCRSARRNGGEPALRDRYCGFRLSAVPASLEQRQSGR